MLEGLLQLPTWGYITLGLILTQITIASVTIYLHRHQAHNALELHPVISHFFRFWLWLTTGMNTREWVAVHRKHHAKCETPDDPHSPVVEGLGKILFTGVWFYHKAAQDQETLERYGKGTPDDVMQRHLYNRFPLLGILLMLAIDTVLFGWIGAIIWVVQIGWIPFWAAGVINGIGHFWGYRNYENQDASTNIIPFGLFIGGEELHNNHHGHASSARLSHKWYELDLGWMYIQALQFFGLARVKKVAPRSQLLKDKTSIDLETVRAVVRNRFHIMKLYAKQVIWPTVREERRGQSSQIQGLLRRARRLMSREDITLDSVGEATIRQARQHSSNLNTVFEFKQRLKLLWQQSATNHARRLDALQVWCLEAEKSGISYLQEFAQSLRGYSLKTA